MWRAARGQVLIQAIERTHGIVPIARAAYLLRSSSYFSGISECILLDWSGGATRPMSRNEMLLLSLALAVSVIKGKRQL